MSITCFLMRTFKFYKKNLNILVIVYSSLVENIIFCFTANQALKWLKGALRGFKSF